MKSERKLSDARCQCAGCGDYFNSDSAFDKHRTGPYNKRRCLTAYEMTAAGMALNPTGWWVGSLWDGPTLFGSLKIRSAGPLYGVYEWLTR